MPRKKVGKSAVDERLRHFEQACRKMGLRLTHQRLEIFRELAEATDHPSAEIIHRRLRSRIPTLSLDTIYRTLSTFEHRNMVSRVQTLESQARFEAETGLHHHLICDTCNEITDFQWKSFDGSGLPGNFSKWGRIDSRKATLRGTCKSCLQTVRPGKPKQR